MSATTPASIVPALEVENVSHFFGRFQVLAGVTFEITPGDIVCVLGPSGSGKSTLLRIISGLLVPTHGQIRIDGKDQSGLPTYSRNLGYVFQTPTALFPHLNVYQNVAFPFSKGKRPSPTERDWQQEVAEMLHIVELGPFREKSIARLSGGQLQRVALARALVYRPSLLLLDEPLSSLDNVLRNTMLNLLLELHKKFQTTFVYVTHDEREALRIASKMAVLHEGKLCQFGPTKEVVAKPNTPAVAEIVGGWNLLKGRVKAESPGRIWISDTAWFLLPPGCKVDGEYVSVGAPAIATKLLPDRPGPDDNEVVLPVKVVNRSPWYRGTRCDCIHGENIRLVAYGDAAPSGPDELGFAVLRKEDLRVFSG